MNIKDQIRAEIERQMKYYEEKEMREWDEQNDEDALWHQGHRKMCSKLLSFLDSIPEQPVIKKSNALFDKCVENCDPAVMKEVSDNVDKMLGRKPVEELEEEIDKYLEPIQAWEVQEAPFSSLEKCARHFAEWGMNQCPLPEDTTIFQKGVAEGRRLEKEDNISLIESRIAVILGDAQPAPILRTELMELIEKIKK